MSDYLLSLIRTYVPIAVGALISWLATMGLDIDSGAQTGLVVFLTALAQGVYYTAVRLLERKWPALGKLLGSAKTPTYEVPK